MPFFKVRTKWLIAAALAMISIILALLASDGNLRNSPVLIPTALISNIIVVGGPDGSGYASVWVFAFVLVTLLMWTAVWYGVLAVVMRLVTSFKEFN